MTDQQHRAVNLGRPIVDWKPRYQIQCACGRLTRIGSRKQVEQEQKNHRKEAKNDQRK